MNARFLLGEQLFEGVVYKRYVFEVETTPGEVPPDTWDDPQLRVGHALDLIRVVLRRALLWLWPL